MGKLEVLLLTAILVQQWIGNTAKLDYLKASKKHSSTAKKRDDMYTLLTQPETPPTGMFSVKSPPSGSSLTAVTGDGTTDDTSAIQAIIDYAARSATHKKVFFPPGEYLVSDNIIVKESVQLHGSVDNISVIKASRAFTYRIKNTGPVSSVRLENLFFDGIHVLFDYSATRDVTVQKCVFFSKTRPGVSRKRKEDGQLQLKRLSNGRVEECIFLRDSHAFGVGATFYRTRNSIVRDNVFGLDLSRIGWLSTQLGGRYWTKQEEKLGFLKNEYTLPKDQGFFKSSLYDAYDIDMRIWMNVFNGSPHAGSLHKDHVIYLKGFDGMYVERNYARGWPSDPSGGIKARNGQNLKIARNYIDDTGILLYSHDPRSTPLHPGLKNVIIYGNRIVIRTNRGHRTTGISYYEPHWQTHSGPDENLKYAANEFQFPGITNSTDTCINLTNGDLAHHHIYEDNVYYPLATPPRKVTLAARSTSTFESGNIDPSISNRFNYSVYKLNIPVYS